MVYNFGCVSVCMCVCACVYMFVSLMITFKSLDVGSAHPVYLHLQGIWVKLMCGGHRVQVEFTGTQKSKILIPAMLTFDRP